MRYENTLDALKTLLKAESLRRPLVIHLEDAHWLDRESAEFLAKLLHNIDDYPLLLLVTTRHVEAHSPEFDIAGALPAEITQSTVDLSALDRAAITAVAAELLGGPIAPSLADELTRRADGNPFFAEQIMLYLREQRLLHRTGDGWQLDTTAGDGFTAHAVLSGDVRAILTARLDRLAGPVKEVVLAAAVLGREFDTRVLLHMLQANAELKFKLQAATDAALWSAVEETRYLFRHALLRDAAYDMQLRARLRDLHSRAAAAIRTTFADDLPPRYADLAYHYQRSEEPQLEQSYAGLAGGYAAETFANQEALRFFDRALALLDNDATTARYELLLQREQVANTSGDRNRQDADTATLVALADTLRDPARQAEARLRRAGYARVVNEYDAALEGAQAALGHAARAADDALTMRGYIEWGKALLRRNRYDAAAERFEQARVLAGRIGAQAEEADLFYHLGLIDHYQARHAAALQRFEAAHSRFHGLGDQKGESMCLVMRATVANVLGDYSETLRLAHAVQENANAIGWKHLQAHTRALLGNNAYDLGQFERAREWHRQAIALARELADSEGEARSLDTLGLIESLRGAHTEALELLTAAQTIQAAIGDRHGLAYTLTHRGYALLAVKRVVEAGIAFAQAVQIRRELASTAGVIDSLVGLAESARRRQRLDEEQQHAAEIWDWLQHEDARGLEFPIHAYLTCAQIFADSAAQKPDYAHLAAAAIEAGAQLLDARAAAITDTTLRRTFLTAIPIHAQLQQLLSRNPQ